MHESGGTTTVGVRYSSGSGIKDINGNSIEGEFIRYHQFPSLADVPHVVTNSNSTTIRIMGFEIPNLQAVLDEFPEITKKLKGIVIVRRKRDTQNNRSIFSRGIAHRMLVQEAFSPGEGLVFYSNPKNVQDGPNIYQRWDTGNFGNYIDDDGGVSPYRNDYMLRVDPFCDNLFITRDCPGYKSLIITCGERFVNTNVNYLAFYSPETILGALQNPPAGYSLQQEIFMDGYCHNVNSVTPLSSAEGSLTDTDDINTSGIAGYKILMYDYHLGQQVTNNLFSFNI